MPLVRCLPTKQVPALTAGVVSSRRPRQAGMVIGVVPRYDPHGMGMPAARPDIAPDGRRRALSISTVQAREVGFIHRERELQHLRVFCCVTVGFCWACHSFVWCAGVCGLAYSSVVFFFSPPSRLLPRADGPFYFSYAHGVALRVFLPTPKPPTHPPTPCVAVSAHRRRTLGDTSLARRATRHPEEQFFAGPELADHRQGWQRHCPRPRGGVG